MKYATLCLTILISTGCVTQTRYDNLQAQYDSINNEKEVLTQSLSSAQNEKAGKIFQQQQRIKQLEQNISLLKDQCKEKIASLSANEKEMNQDLQALRTEASENTKYLLNKNLELQERCNAM